MRAVLLDTHAWAWSLAADTVMVSPISFFEIAQKVRLGQWPQMAPFVDELPARLDRPS